MTTSHSLDVPGARLHHEIRGAGPLLLLMGSPMGAAPFAPMADALAGEHTVVTYDPRGISGSPIDDPEQDSTPELRADDVALLLDALGAEFADVFGSSGGAVTGLALVEQHPGRVRTLVAHEPPLLELLPDAAHRRAQVDDVVETFHRDGHQAAWAKFMASSGFEDHGDGGTATGGTATGNVPPTEEPSEQNLADAARFFGHELQDTTRYAPDIGTLTASPTRVVVGIGAESGGLDTYLTSTALAERLRVSPVEFPGDHTGFIDRPDDFAKVLRDVLTGETRPSADSGA